MVVRGLHLGRGEVIDLAVQTLGVDPVDVVQGGVLHVLEAAPGTSLL
jgi:hypothetical protein